MVAPRVTQDFACYGCEDDHPNAYHTGIDLTDATRAQEGCIGTPVTAAASGTVYRTVFGCVAGPTNQSCGRGYGNHVVLGHPDGSYTLYAHLFAAEVSAGESVGPGDQLGTMGTTGATAACHVHFAVLDFAPGPPGDYSDLGQPSGVVAYQTGYPTSGCGSGACLDPKQLVTRFPVGIDGPADVLERPNVPGSCIAELDTDQAYVAIARWGSWYYLMLPSDVGPRVYQGNSSCTSQATFGWTDAYVTPPSGYGVIADGVALEGAGLNVREYPGGPVLTRLWGGHHYRTTANLQSAGSGCDEHWYEVHIPSQRADGHELGWACGDYLTDYGGYCQALSADGSSPDASLCIPGSVCSVTTTDATSATQTSASLNMEVNSGAYQTDVWFRWGPTTSVVNTTSTANAGAGTTPVPITIPLGGLSCNTQYYFQAWGENQAGQDSGDILSFTTAACGGGGGTQQLELIQNGNFEQDDAFWTVVGDFYADRRFGNYNFSPGYAYLSNADGTPGNGLVGFIHQQVTIPSSATAATLRYWRSMTTFEPAGGPPEDVLNATIQDQNGNFLATIEVLSNQAGSFGYAEREFNVASYAGMTIRLNFLGTTNSDTQPTVFRIDDVSLIATVPTGGPPTVTTEPADQITSQSARLNLQANPNGGTTEVWFRLEANDSTPNDETAHLGIGSGTSTLPVNISAFDLQCDTLYYFQARASNSFGTASGVVRSFMTGACPGGPPDVDTDPADSITMNSARLRAVVNPGSLATDARFDWSTTPALGTLTPNQGIGSGSVGVLVTQVITGLDCDTTYYYNALAQNSAGGDQGTTHSFSTEPCPGPPPSVFTLSADHITATTARLGGLCDPEGQETDCWMEWGLTAALGNSTPRQPVGSGTNGVVVNADIGGLTCGQTYQHAAMAENASGTTAGNTLSFSTPACGTPQPEATTLPPDQIVPGSVRFNSQVLNYNLDSFAWFEIGDTPDAVDIATPPLYVPPSPAWMPFAQAFEGNLLCGTTYYVRAWVQTTGGTGSGAQLSFATAGCSPLPIFSDGFESGDSCSWSPSAQGSVSFVTEDTVALGAMADFSITFDFTALCGDKYIEARWGRGPTPTAALGFWFTIEDSMGIYSLGTTPFVWMTALGPPPPGDTGTHFQIPSGTTRRFILTVRFDPAGVSNQYRMRLAGITFDDDGNDDDGDYILLPGYVTGYETAGSGLQLRPTANKNRFNYFSSSDHAVSPGRRPGLVVTPAP